MKAIIGDSFVIKGGEIASYEKAIGDAEIIAVYHSAHWCPPCRAFTPKLGEVYEAMKKAGKKIQIVFASCDKTEEQFKEYFGTMPWVSIPFKHPILTQVQEAPGHEVQGIPCLHIFNKSGKRIEDNGRETISANKEAAYGVWMAK